MKSTAATVEQYLASLPEARREAVGVVRRALLGYLGKEFEECMQYGVIGYCVPHSVWPHGHHTRADLALMYMGLSSQKNDMVVYMLFLQHDQTEREWFVKAWEASGKKLRMDVGGMGCCVRFKKVEELSLDVIGEAMRRVPLKKYLKDHAAVLARIGKGPDGKALKKGAGGNAAGGVKGRGAVAAKSTTNKRKKVTRKKSVTKRA